MAEEMESGLNATFDYINPNNNKDIEILWDNYINEMKSKGDDIFYQSENDTEDIEDLEPTYAYFSIINPTFSNGMQFLNP
jgi:hypothetical protein